MAKKADNTFEVIFNRFYQGFAPDAHLDTLSELGNSGHASTMSEADILTPRFITQGPGLSNLTNGTQTGAVDELISFIMDKAVASSQTYGIGATKLFRIAPSTVTNSGAWPHTITGATDGESVEYLKGNLYYFYNKSSGADIGKFDLSSTFDDDWGSTTPSGAAALQKALHPVASKEDLMVFGNGRYLGLYNATSDTLSPTKLDFGNNHEVADVVFHANQWLLAVNYGVTGTNRTTSQVFLYDGSGVSSILSDEVAVGVQRIGFLFPIDGVVFIAYQDLSFAGGFKIGFINGRQITDIGSFTGSLPGFNQKTLYKNTILYATSGLIYSTGAVIDSLPIQTSAHADGGYATVGALAAPFGTPMVASTDGGSNQRLAKFSGLSTASTWRSIVVPTIKGIHKGYIDRIIVITTTLGANARCDLQLEYDQASANSGTVKQITTANKRRHVFKDLAPASKTIEDFRVFLDWSNGNASNGCPIRKIIVEGHFIKV